MNSAVDLSTDSATISQVAESRSQTAAYFWIALAALFGLVMIGGVAGSYYMDTMNLIDAPFVGP